MTTKIWITAQFVGYHRWVDAPTSVEFLRNFHRHMLHVRVEYKVSHKNRALEFFEMKQRLETFLAVNLIGRFTELSCEQMAELILKGVQADSVTVSEDGENGAEVEA